MAQMPKETQLKPSPQSNGTIGQRILLWVKERYDISALESFLAKKRVPMHRHSIWYYFGGITLFFFVIQVITGILLLLYYRPTAEAAFESVQFIMTEVRFGWLIRSIHSWSANLMVAAAFIHLFSVYFMKAYRKPRELTWVSGVFLLFLSLGFGFSGYLLPWNELAFFATKVGTEVVALVPLVGGFLLKFLRGGEDVTGATLTRFFGFHVAVLPMIATLLLAFHLWVVQKQGMSVPLSLERSGQPIRSMPFFPNFLLRDVLGWVLALGVLVAIAALFPWELGVKADPFAPAPAGIQPEWYFVFMFQTLKFIPAKLLFLDGEVLGIAGFGVSGVLLVLVPFWDRKSRLGQSGRLVTVLGVLALAYIIIMTLISYLVPQTF
ncbi:MAG: cytochrome bc complex cytochrome b subunit [Nitrospiria bacterium]